MYSNLQRDYNRRETAAARETSGLVTPVKREE